eukprot:CAMPEP_0167758782 /NCGR_PEP_ID=MMETSP0110_2-20121227/10657_1 /TAXON_ID=629695 /ORGANISM="Gymnochlora sp., Strain CCMP2014" /LENGTH=157 /DNA_ID=CAMNT_0007645091 /DNA_START=269 /DNA_END=742 /DNA_ORIENTATION=+
MSASADNADAEQTSDTSEDIDTDDEPQSFSMREIIETIKDDISNHQYLITGDLNEVIYAPNCEFKQPLQTIKGPGAFKSKMATLWDQNKSKVELLEIAEEDPSHIVATWRISGVLKNFYLFGGGKLAPFIGRTKYTLDPQSNKVTYSFEEWESTPWG